MSQLRRTDGTTENVTGEGPDGTLTLEQMQRLVGGYIEIVPLRGHEEQLLVVNEDGKLKQLPVNSLATEEYMRFYGPRDVIVGDAILAEGWEVP